MRGLGRRGWGLLVLLLVAPGAAILLARLVPALDPVLESPRFHVIVVSAIAACALVVALATAVAAARDRRPDHVLRALGCVCVGSFLLAHGLTTPGMLDQPLNLWVGRLGALALIGFAACLGASLHTSGIVSRVIARAPRYALLVSTGAVLGFSAAIVADPTIWSGIQPFAFEEQIRTVLLVASGASLLVTGAVHWGSWRLGRDRVELSLALACWLTMSAILSLSFGAFWRLSWWDYHLYLLAAFGTTSWAIVTGYRRTRSLAAAVAGIGVRDPLVQISREQPEAFDALIGAVEAKDPYTFGHSARVAELSGRIGVRIGLEPETLRALHQGASLHDVGKISVPDRILSKPGALTDDEWAAIEAHPVTGWELASRAPSLRDSMAAIRHHHERWDGSGYPDGRAGADIPLAGRIVAVADVWDALTSDRAYREAWPLDRAVSHIVGAAGTLFDPLCVEAFLDVLKEQGVVPDRARPDLDALFARALDCHPQERRPGRTARASAVRSDG